MSAEEKAIAEAVEKALEEKLEVVQLKKLEEKLVSKLDEISEFRDRVEGELKTNGEAAAETKGELGKLIGQYNDIFDRIEGLEQSAVSKKAEAESFDIGAEFIKSDQFKDLQDGRTGRAKVEFKTAIINATGQNQPLVAADRLPGFNTTPNRVLTIRDVLPSSPTDSNLIEFVRENVFTNNAGPTVSGSPEAYENVTKPESGITFTLQNEAVVTLAHWIPASKQVIADSAGLQAFISGRLMYGLKLKEETQLLSGTGANHQLNGLITQATAWTNESPNITNEVDIIRSAIKQAHVAEYRPDFVVLNPQDWFDIETRKVGGSDDRYVVGNPRNMSTPSLWSLPIVVTNSISSGTFLIGSSMGAEIKDREQAMVEVSRENSDNFVKNMITILAEERLALVVYRTEAFITGSL